MIYEFLENGVELLRTNFVKISHFLLMVFRQAEQESGF